MSPPAGRGKLLLRSSGGEVSDRVFQSAMTACGLAVLGLLVLIVYELMYRSGLSWHAFGLKFFGASDWDPVNEHFGALPFIYGTIVSSLVALVIAVPLAVGVAVFTTEMCPKALRGRDTQCDLRTVGDFCARPTLERIYRTLPRQDAWLDRTF
jgi:phosphate transport system permease protein